MIVSTGGILIRNPLVFPFAPIYPDAVSRLIMGVAFIMIACGCAKPQNDPLLDRPIPRFGSVSTNEFGDLCHRLRAPCGQEIYERDFFSPSNSALFRTHAELDLRDKTPRQILDVIVERHPKYRWEYVDGVLLLLPDGSEHQPAFARTIDSFDASDETVEIAGCRFGESVGMRCGGESVISSRSLQAVEDERVSTAKRVSLHLKRKTALQVSNALVAANGHAEWKFVHEEGMGRKYRVAGVEEGKDQPDFLLFHFY